VTFDVFFPGTNPRKIEKPHMTAKIRIEAKLLTRKVATASCCISLWSSKDEIIVLNILSPSQRV
jgi:hypothetical protein